MSASLKHFRSLCRFAWCLAGVFLLISPSTAVNYTVTLKTTRCLNNCNDNLYDDSRTCPSSIIVNGKEKSLKKDGFNILSLPKEESTYYRWFDASEKAKYEMFKRLFTTLDQNSVVFIVLQNMCSAFDRLWYEKLAQDIDLTLKHPTDRSALYDIAVVAACKGKCSDLGLFMKTYYGFNRTEYATTFDFEILPVKPVEKKNGNGVLIAVIVVILLLIIIISIGIFIYRQRHKEHIPPPCSKTMDVVDGDQYRNNYALKNKDSEEQNYLVPSNIPKKQQNGGEYDYVNVNRKLPESQKLKDNYNDEYERMDGNEYAEPRVDGRFGDGDDDVYVNMTPDAFTRKNTTKSKDSEDDPYERMDGNPSDYERMDGGNDEYERMDLYNGETVF